MLIFGHIGITLGAGALLAGTLRGNSRSASINGKASWFVSLGRYIDIRLLLLGSLLPDVIDKPVGQFFFRETFSHGRIFSHTLLFLVALALGGLYLYRRHGKNWLLVLAFGTFAHLILDEMWLTPRTLFWPLYGLTFERAELAGWMANIFLSLITKPGVYVPELVGAAVLLWFLVTLARRKKILAFVSRGQV